MKKCVKIILGVLLLISTFSFSLHKHIHALDLGDAIGPCDVCSAVGSTNIGTYYLDVIEAQPTCTMAGIGVAVCNVCGNTKTVVVPALGHDYQLTSSVAPTCTGNGSETYTCSRCNDSYTNVLAATGHSYLAKITKVPTCTETGIRTYTCSKCHASFTEVLAALGHDIEYEEKEASCTEAGYKKGVCKRCGEEFSETYPALGHDLDEMKVVKEATCSEEGITEAICKVCNEKIIGKIPLLPHEYPEEWTVEKEAGFFAEGLKIKVCGVCGERLEEAIPRKDPLPLYIGGGALGLLGAILLILKKAGRLGSKTLKKAAEELTKKPLPSFEDKTVLACTADEDLVNELKKRHFLQISSCEYEEIDGTVEESAPDLLLVDILSDERLDEFKKKKDKTLKEINVGLLADEELIRHHKRKLDNLVKNEKIINYLPYGSDPYTVMVDLVLPVLKPDLKSDESLSNVGMIADALGIPAVSTVIDFYLAGRDIKATLEESELGISETATIINDIASVLGLDQVAAISGLVGDIDSIKAAIDKEAGTYEEKKGIKATKDVVEVVSDIIKK